MDRQHIRRLFRTPPIEKIPISKKDLRLASAQRARTHRAGRFDFAEDEVVVRTLPAEARGGSIAFPSRVTVGPDVLSFVVSWLFRLYDQPHWLGQHAWMEEVEMGLPFAGHPFGNALGHFFQGRCRGPKGVLFSEKSWVLRVLFISKGELIKLAVALSRESQEPLLLKSAAEGEIFLVSSSDPDTEILPPPRG